MIIGCCGAGKSTLGKRLRQKTGLELIHLDQKYFSPNWVEPSPEVWADRVAEMAKKDNWIIDGNYGGTMDIRLEAADTILFLDRSRWLCLYRVIKRIILNYGKKRSDSAAGCPERFEWAFLVYTFRFYDVKRPEILKRLEVLPKSKKIIVLKSDKATESFLKELEN